jgi:hypothetical protein
MAKKKKVEPIESNIDVYMPCEWVIQFDDDEPQIFATADENTAVPEVTIRLQNTSESHMTFVDTVRNKRFRMFARPKA